MWWISMETFSYIMAVVLILAVAIYIYGTGHHGTLKKLGIDGPKPKPFIGNLIDSFSSEQHLGAYDLSMKNKYGKIVGFIEGRYVSIAIHDPDMLKEIMIKEFSNFHCRRKFVMRSWVRNSMAEMRDLHDWKRIRTIVSPFFSSGKMKLHSKPVNRCADTLLQHLTMLSNKKESFEARYMIDAFTLDVICAIAFGMEVDAQSNPDNPFIKILRSILDIDFTSVKIVSSVIIPEFYEFLDWLGLGHRIHIFPKGMLEFFAAAIDLMIKERRESKENRPDFVQALLEAQDEQKKTLKGEGKSTKALSTEEIWAQSFLFFIAGYDTVASTLSYLVYCLALNQDIQDKLVREVNDVLQGREYVTEDDLLKMPYMDMCLDESLRLYPAAYRTEREAAEDIVVKGVKIPKGALVQIPLWSISHDPEFWDSPETFNPDRFSEEAKASRNSHVFLPFGIGPRSCVGMRLARKEVKITMAKILPKLRFVPNEKTEVPLTFKASIFVNTVNGVHLNAERRN